MISTYESKVKHTDKAKINEQIQLKRSKRFEQTTWVETEERELKEAQRKAHFMLQDIQNGTKTEIEAIAGALVEHAFNRNKSLQLPSN